MFFNLKVNCRFAFDACNRVKHCYMPLIIKVHFSCVHRACWRCQSRCLDAYSAYHQRTHDNPKQGQSLHVSHTILLAPKRPEFVAGSDRSSLRDHFGRWGSRTRLSEAGRRANSSLFALTAEQLLQMTLLTATHASIGAWLLLAR